MSDDPDVIEREVLIAAAPDVVFGFLVDRTLLAEWLGLSDTLEPRPGGTFRVVVSEGNVARGVYVEVVPPRRVVFTWGWESAPPEAPWASMPPGSSVVEIDLEPVAGGTRLHLRHRHLPPSTLGSHAERWSHRLARLAAVAAGDRRSQRRP